MASKAEEIKMINFFAKNLDRLKEKNTDKPYEEMKSKFKFRRSVSFLRDHFLNAILPNLFKYKCLDNETMVNFYDRADMEIPDELVSIIDAYCKLQCTPNKRDSDTISIISSESEDELLPVILPPLNKKPTTQTKQTTAPNQSTQQKEIHLKTKTNLYKHAPSKRDFDTISISSTDSVDDLPPAKLPKQFDQNFQDVDQKTQTAPNESTQQNEIHIKPNVYPGQLRLKVIRLQKHPDQLKLNRNVSNQNRTKENGTQTTVDTSSNESQTRLQTNTQDPNQFQMKKSLTKTNRDQCTSTQETTTTDPISMITQQIAQKTIESDLNLLKPSETEITNRNNYVLELDDSDTDSNMSIISLNTKLGSHNSQYQKQQIKQIEIDENPLRLIDKYTLPLTHLDRYRTYQFDSPIYSPIHEDLDLFPQSDPQAPMDFDVTRDFCAQTTEIITEDKCTMVDSEDFNHNGWRLISADGKIEIGWSKSDHFFIPKSDGNMARNISENHQIPDEQIHSVDETNFAIMLKFKTIKVRCENLLWTKSEKNKRKTNETNTQTIETDKSETIVHEINDSTYKPIITSEISSARINSIKNNNEPEVTLTKIAKNSASVIIPTKNSDISIITSDHANNSIKTTENSDISINTIKNCNKSIKTSENGAISISTTDHGNNLNKTTENISINTTKNGNNSLNISENGNILNETTKMCTHNNEVTSSKPANNSDNSIKATDNGDISMKTTEICDQSIKTSENLNLSVDDDRNSSINSESIFYTAEANETAALNYFTPATSSPVLNNRCTKQTEMNSSINLNIGDDSASNMLLSIDSEEILIENPQIEARMSENSSIFLPSNHNTENSNDSILDESVNLAVNNKSATVSRKLSGEQHTINKLKLNNCEQTINLNTIEQHKVGNNSKDPLSIEDEGISTKMTENNQFTTSKSNDSSPSNNVTSTEMCKETSDKECESAALFKQITLKSTKKEIKTKFYSPNFVIKKNKPETDSITNKSIETNFNSSLSPSNSDNLVSESIELGDFFPDSIDAVMNFIANPNQKIVTSTQIEGTPLKSLDSSNITPKKLNRSESPHDIINNSIDDVMNYITSPSLNIVTNTQIEVSPLNKSNPKCPRNLIDNMDVVNDHILNLNQHISSVSGNRVDPILAQNCSIVISENSNKMPEKTANIRKCTQNEESSNVLCKLGRNANIPGYICTNNEQLAIVPPSFSEKSNKGIPRLVINSVSDSNINIPKNVKSPNSVAHCEQNKQSAITPNLFNVSSGNITNISRFATNCVNDPNANKSEENIISLRTNASSIQHSSMNTFDNSMNLITNKVEHMLDHLKNDLKDESVVASSADDKRKTPETYAFAQSSKNNAEENSTTLSERKMQDIFNVVQSTAIATAQDFHLPLEYILNTPYFSNVQFDYMKTPQNSAVTSTKLRNKPNTKSRRSTRRSGSFSTKNMCKSKKSKSNNGLLNILVTNPVKTSKYSNSKERATAKYSYTKERKKKRYHITYDDNIPEHAYAVKYFPQSAETFKSKSSKKKELNIQSYEKRKSLVLNKIHLESKEQARNQKTPSTDTKLPLPPKNDCIKIVINTPKQQVTATVGQPEQSLKIDQCDSTMSPTLETSEKNVDQKVSPDKPEQLLQNAKVTPLLIRRNPKTKWDCIPILSEEAGASYLSEKSKLKDNSPQQNNYLLISLKDNCLNASKSHRTMNESYNTPIKTNPQKDKNSNIAPNANQTVTSTDTPESDLKNTKLSPVNVGSNLKTKCFFSAVLNSSEETRKLNNSVNSKLLVNSLHNNIKLLPLKDVCLNSSKRPRPMNESSNMPVTKKQNLLLKILTTPNANQTVISTNKRESVLQNTKLSLVNVGINPKTKYCCSTLLNSSEKNRKLTDSVTQIDKSPHIAPNDKQTDTSSKSINVESNPVNLLSDLKTKDVCTICLNNELAMKTKVQTNLVKQIDKSPDITSTSNQTITSSDSILQKVELTPVNLLSDLKTKWQCSTRNNSLIEARELDSTINTNMINNFQQAPDSPFVIKDVFTIPINRELTINKFINTKISTKLQEDVELILEKSMSSPALSNNVPQKKPENTVILNKTPEPTTTELNSTIVTDELSTYMELTQIDPEIVSINDALQTSPQAANSNDELRTQKTKLGNIISKSVRKRKVEELDSSWNGDSPQLLLKKARLLPEKETNTLRKHCTVNSRVANSPVNKQTHENTLISCRVSPKLRKSKSNEKNSDIVHFKIDLNCSRTSTSKSKRIWDSLVKHWEIDSVCINNTNASTISPELTCKSKDNYNSEQTQIYSENESVVSCASSPISNKIPLICDNSLKNPSPNSSLWIDKIVSDSEPSTPESKLIPIQKPIAIKQTVINEHMYRKLPRSSSPVQLNTIVSDSEPSTPGSRIIPIQDSIEIKQKIIDAPQLFRILPQTNQPIALNSEPRTPDSHIIPIGELIEIKQEQIDESLYTDLELAAQSQNTAEIKEKIVIPLMVFSPHPNCEHLMSKKSKMAVKKLCIDTTHLDVKRFVSNIANTIDVRFEKEEIDDVTVNPIYEVVDTKQEFNLEDDEDNTVTQSVL